MDGRRKKDGFRGFLKLGVVLEVDGIEICGVGLAAEEDILYNFILFRKKKQ